jgi:predicted GNAT family acetyltransferase
VEFYSRIFNLSPVLDIYEEAFLELINKIKNGIAPKRISVNKGTNSSQIEEKLKMMGFINSYHQTLMAIDLDAFEVSENNDYEIKIVSSDKDLCQWLLAVEAIFGTKEDFAFYKLLIKLENIKMYGVFYKKQIVSTLLSYSRESVTGIHLVGTFNDFRNSGFGAIITNKALADAKMMGFNLCVLQASDMGKSVYKKIGFNEYSILNQWVYKDN